MRILEQLRHDLLYGARMLTKQRGFTTAAVLTVALGIGANTAIFTIVDTVVFRPLPYKDPARLVKIWGSGVQHPLADVSFADFVDIRDQNHVFEAVAADDGEGVTVEYGGARESVNAAFVTEDWLSTLGVQPLLGRAFVAEEARPGRNRVVMLSHRYWQRRFGSDPNAVGQSLVVDAQPVIVVGVLPPNVLRYSADLLRPLVPAEYPVERGHRDLDVFARLRPGVTLARAQVEIETIARRLAREYPATNQGRGFQVVALDKYYASIDTKAREGLVLMLGAVGLVLLIACVNVSNLLLARAIGRARECAIRVALGASRARLVRQLLTEYVLLFLAGGVLGILLARWSLRALLVLAVGSGYVPERMAVSLDARVFAFSLMASLVTGVVFGLFPALRATGVDLTAGLKDSGSTSHTGSRQGRTRRVLIVSELVLSLVLLVGFGLLIRSFVRVLANAGSLAADTLLETSADGGRSFVAAVAFWRAALEQAQAVPGIEAVAVTSRPPVHGARQQAFVVAGQSDLQSGEPPRAGDILVSSEYFRTVGIPPLRGRVFTDNDTGSSLPVVVISQRLARRYFPGRDPIGRRLSLREQSPMMCCSAAGPVENVWREVVGVVGDIRQANLDEEPAATIYRPYSQIIEHDMYLLARVRSAAEVPRAASELRSRLQLLNPGTEWVDVRVMRELIDQSESIRLRRFVLILLGTFAGLALLLAGVGLYGVMAYFVAERRREIAIRVALGAARSDVFRQVMGEAMRLALASLLLGAVTPTS
jgi:putative ABC transport system permease protein